MDGSAGSTDGTYGSGIVGANTAAPAYAVRTIFPGSNDTVGVQIKNNTGPPLLFLDMERPMVQRKGIAISLMLAQASSRAEILVAWDDFSLLKH